jgi:hypothetical protein
VRPKLAMRKLIPIVVDNVTKHRQHHGVGSAIPSSDSGHSGGGLIIALLRSKAIMSRETEGVCGWVLRDGRWDATYHRG